MSKPCSDTVPVNSDPVPTWYVFPLILIPTSYVSPMFSASDYAPFVGTLVSILNVSLWSHSLRTMFPLFSGLDFLQT